MEKDLTVLEACIKLLETTLDSGISSSKADEIVKEVINLLKLVKEN